MYTMSAPSGILRKDGIEIPQDDRFPEYREYVAWLAAGNGPALVQDPAPRPRIEVSARQIRKALNATGLRQAVEDAVAASDDIDVKDGYHYAPYFWSDDPLTLGLGAALGKTEADMYALFLLAESL